MNWRQLLTTRRLGDHDDSPGAPRSAYQRDWDRILYSPHFRRLAGKTQVFPLPLDDHIHSRLTHSLEVATVGRSLGTLVGHRIRTALPADIEARDLGDCVAAACLAHDMGNPPFGHVGEVAIQELFERHRDAPWFREFSQTQRHDLLAFEGNAVALRLATGAAGPLSPRGLDLSCATLGALVKYPCASVDAEGRQAARKSRSKHGIDTPELEVYAQAAAELGLPVDPAAHRAWRRHPLSFLTEAADDIAYQIIDLEDGLRLRHISQAELLDLLRPLCERDPRCPPLAPVRDREAMLDLAGRLRSIAINTLIHEVADVFERELEAILAGDFDEALVGHIASRPAVEQITKKNATACYSARDVLKLELTGSVAIQAVLDALIDAALPGSNGVRAKHLRKLLPGVFPDADLYTRVLKLTDFVAGMTDHYVVRLYRELSGIRLPGGRD